jgi:hypothetical protein
MSVTDEAIDNTAAAFCLLSKNPDHKALYIESLKAIARMAEAELVFRMELDYAKATTAWAH